MTRCLSGQLLLSAVSAIALGLMAPLASAGNRVNADQEMRGALVDAHLPQQLLTTFCRKLNEAASLAASPSATARAGALRRLDEARQLLDQPDMGMVNTGVRQALHLRLEALTAATRNSLTTNSAPLTVHVFLATDTNPVAAGAGVSVRVDGVEVTTTGPDGVATVNVTTDDRVVAAASAIDFGGSVRLPSDGTTPSSVDVVMESGSDFSLAGAGDIDEQTDGVVPGDFTSFTVSLRDTFGTPISIAQINSVQLDTATGPRDLTADFTRVADGKIATMNAAALRAVLLDGYGPHLLTVRASDAQSRPFAGRVQFDLGRHHVTGTLTSTSGIPLSGVPLRLTNQRNHFSFWTTTAAGGSVTFPRLLPEGLYIAHAETVSNGIRYFAHTSFVAESDTTFTASFVTVDNH